MHIKSVLLRFPVLFSCVTSERNIEEELRCEPPNNSEDYIKIEKNPTGARKHPKPHVTQGNTGRLMYRERQKTRPEQFFFILRKNNNTIRTSEKNKIPHNKMA